MPEALITSIAVDNATLSSVVSGENAEVTNINTPNVVEYLAYQHWRKDVSSRL